MRTRACWFQWEGRGQGQTAGEAGVHWRVPGNSLSTHLSWDWSEVGGTLCVCDLLRGGSLGEGLVKGQGHQGAEPNL